MASFDLNAPVASVFHAVPRSLGDYPPFSILSFEDCRPIPALYVYLEVIGGRYHPTYAGQALNVRTRHQQHRERDAWFVGTRELAILPFDRGQLAMDAAEARLIGALEPFENVHHQPINLTPARRRLIAAMAEHDVVERYSQASYLAGAVGGLFGALPGPRPQGIGSLIADYVRPPPHRGGLLGD